MCATQGVYRAVCRQTCNETPIVCYFVYTTYSHILVSMIFNILVGPVGLDVWEGGKGKLYVRPKDVVPRDRLMVPVAGGSGCGKSLVLGRSQLLHAVVVISRFPGGHGVRGGDRCCNRCVYPSLISNVPGRQVAYRER